jgi:hypothetical protein
MLALGRAHGRAAQEHAGKVKKNRLREQFGDHLMAKAANRALCGIDPVVSMRPTGKT